MNPFYKWLTNFIVIIIAVVLIPGIQITQYIFPVLAIAILAKIITGLHPDLIDSDAEFLEIGFFFISFLINMVLFMVLTTAVPGIRSNGFVPNLILGFITALSTTILHTRFKKIPN
ncbi:MAG: hypothetical protein JWO40_592 [Candidatus Doudnabacteria bacterium]|nr:hypothetical protein [Candidatus Doudnabacteria bacterium]